MRNVYEVQGRTTTLFLPRKNGLVLKAFINTEDLPKVQMIPNTWFACWDPGTSSYRVCGMVYENDKRKSVWLHRYLTDAPTGTDVDHIDHDQLNNRRSNLRILTHSENHQNRNRPNKNNTSGYLGVTWSKYNYCWVAKLRVSGRYVYVGSFKDKELAAKAITQARARLMPYSQEAMAQ